MKKKQDMLNEKKTSAKPIKEKEVGKNEVLPVEPEGRVLVPAAEEAETNLPAVTEKPKKKLPAKKKKEAKTISVKKLPRLFRKKYTERKYKKKITKHIYIAKDREFVRSFFQPVEGTKRPTVKIPSDTLFSKQDTARLKSLAKQIKKQRGRVKWVPLLACVGVFFVLVSTVVLFKDALIKKGMKSGLEAIFGARCDIAYLHLGILDANFSVRGLEVANKKKTMTNLFEVGNITMDFDLVQLLRKRFVAENLEISNVQVGTPRKTDGALPPKPPKEPSEFQKKLTAFALEKKEVLKDSISGIFAQYNPETLLANFYDQLSSPEVAKEVENQLSIIIPAWKLVPDEITASVTKAIDDSKAAVNFDWASVKSDPTKLKNGIELVSDALKNIETLQAQTEKTVSMLRTDANTVSSLANKVKNAVSADYSLVSSEINKITSFSIKEDGMNIISSAFNTIVTDLLGEYYPMIQMGIAYANEISAMAAKYMPPPKEKKEEKPKIERYKGRTIDYRADKIPSFLIQRAHGSGSNENFGLELTLTDISNDMDKWGKPVSIQASAVHGVMSDALTGSFDLRSDRLGNMIDLKYNGAGYAVNFALPEDQSVEGVPSAVGTGAFSARFGADLDGSFLIGGSIVLSPVTLTATAFEPAFAYDLYNRALAKFNSLDLDLDISYSDRAGLDLDISSDIDRQFVRVLTEIFNEELAVVKEKAAAKVKEMLDKVTAGIEEKFGDFDDIKAKIEEQKVKLDVFKNHLEQKKKDAENQLKAAAEAAVQKATDAAEATVQKATDAAKEKVDSMVDNAKESAKDALKGLFKK